MNFRGRGLVDTDVFRARHRRPPFTDPLNWTDYRWDAGPWHAGRGHHPWAQGRAPWGRGQRRYPLLLLLFAGLAAVLGAKLLSSIQSRNTSWAQRAFFGVVLLAIVAAFSRNRRSRW
jgi:hypothetical protein